MLYRFLWTLIVLFVCAPAAHGREVKVGIGFSLAPYVIQEQNSGVELDVIREAFRVAGHEAVFVYLPNLRLPLAFEVGSVDCIALNAAFDVAAETGRNVFYSDHTVVYQNAAISLASSGFEITSLKDLEDKVVLGFNSASKSLGPEYAAMTKVNARYLELADQSLQVRMLYTDRVQVVVSDKRIFFYWRKKLTEAGLLDGINITRNVSLADIFPLAPRHVAFREPELVVPFNRGLSSIRKNGTFNAILARYVGVEQN